MAKTKKKKHLIKNKRTRLWLKRIRFLFIILSIVFLVSFFRNTLINKDNQKSPENTVNKAATGKTSSESTAVSAITASKVPSANAAAPKADNAKMEPLKQQITNYLKNTDGHFGVYYLNLATGDEVDINAQEEFTAASTIKVPLNLMLYEKIGKGEIDPQDTLTYQKEDYEEGTGILQGKAIGSKYSFRDLSRLSITKSDNVATNMLIRYFSLPALKEYMRQCGGKIVDDTRNTSCPRDMGLYMELIYELYRDNDVECKDLMTSLLNTDFNDRLPALLPGDVKVAHKIGTQEDAVNDVGIIFADKPYILAVMSKNASEGNATEAIANISKIVYKFHTSLQ